MDDGIRARLKHLRTFGLVLGALLAFFAWRWERKGWPAAWWALGAGGLSASVALVRPGLLDGFERRWMSGARAVARVNLRLALALLYYLALFPYALLVRLFSGDPLDRAWGKQDSYWKPHKTGEDLASYERQF